MCGIVGSVGKTEVTDYLLTGLNRLEYRGYDSSGICVIENNNFITVRAVGKISALEAKIEDKALNAYIGIGHTRWATHGKVSEANAHPHVVGKVALVHNGIIENYALLKEELQKAGRKFQTETDTEIIAHLIDISYQTENNKIEAIGKAIKHLRGMFSLAIMFKDDPYSLFAVKNGTPLVIGINGEASYIASDVYPLVEYADRYCFIEDGEIVRLTYDLIDIYNSKGESVSRELLELDIRHDELSKGGYRYYMEKEIHEQPQVIINTIQSRISPARDMVLFDDLNLDAKAISKFKRIYIIACGTAWHAALTGKYNIERLAGIPVDVDIASEFRYRDALIDNEVLTILISQSGETADTLAACREAKKHGSYTIAICNKPNSTLDRESDFTIYTEAGTEIGVAATKSFTAQISILLLVALHFASTLERISSSDLKNILEEFVRIPLLLENAINLADNITHIAKKYIKARTFLFIGRGIHFPVALEGALKLKEITYIHAEGYAAGELKHGPIALVDEDLVLVALCPMDELYEKSISNIEEVSARGGAVIAIGIEGDKRLEKISDVFIPLPRVCRELMPILESVPVQLLAMNVAIAKGTDVDRPRNLAKSVTVE